MSNLISRKTALLALEWCALRYGPSKFAKLKTLHVRLDSSLDCYGEYDCINNEIILNPRKHRTLKSWVATVIHEYTHFLQPMDEKYDRYFKYGRTYDTHPYEITACNREKRDSAEAKAWVLRESRQLNKHG